MVTYLNLISYMLMHITKEQGKKNLMYIKAFMLANLIQYDLL